MPMATIGQKPIFLDDTSALPALASSDFHPRQAVYLSSELRGHITAEADPDAKLLASSVTAGDCRFETESTRQTLLVIVQSWYPCWKAEVDGVAVPLLRANYAFQAIEAPSGRHQVRLAYRDALFYTGAAFSILTLFVCVGGVCLVKSKAE